MVFTSLCLDMIAGFVDVVKIVTIAMRSIEEEMWVSVETTKALLFKYWMRLLYHMENVESVALMSQRGEVHSLLPASEGTRGIIVPVPEAPCRFRHRLVYLWLSHVQEEADLCTIRNYPSYKLFDVCMMSNRFDSYWRWCNGAEVCFLFLQKLRRKRDLVKEVQPFHEAKQLSQPWEFFYS